MVTGGNKVVSINDIMKSWRVWALWRYEEKVNRKGEKRPDKVPYQRSGGHAKSDDPKTWESHDVISKVWRGNKKRYDGISLALSNGLCGIDIDGDKDTGRENPLAEEILKLFSGTYVEKTPSGCGYHILFFATPPEVADEETGELLPLDSVYYVNNQGKHLEQYVAGINNKFFTFTGNKLPEAPDTIADKTDAFRVFLDRYMQKPRLDTTNTEDEGSVKFDLSTPEGEPAVLERIEAARQSRKTGEKFRALYDRGEWEGLFPSQSEADMWLCGRLAYYLDKDPEAIDWAFQRSLLYREKWEREDYSSSTIKKAIAGCKGTYSTTRQQSEGGRQESKYEKVFDYMAQHGYSVRENLLTDTVEIDGLPPELSNKNKLNTFPLWLWDRMNTEGVNVRKNIVAEALILAADLGRYNPVVEMLRGGWDKTHRLQDIFQILGIDGIPKYCVYVSKWLHQAVALALNDEKEPFGADGILVLQGPQGIGKTRFFSRLSVYPSKWFNEGVVLDMTDKDTQIKSTRRFITELGEMDSTLKKEQIDLKAFITSAMDEIRKPYAQHPIRRPRRTSICATVNPDKSLRDETGSRRFWVVEALIDIERLNSLDVAWFIQLWREVYETLYLPDPQGFRLTTEERRVLEHDNVVRYTVPLPAEDEIMSLVDLTLPESQWKYYKAGQIKLEFAHTVLFQRYSVQQIGRALAAIARKHEKVKVTSSKGSLSYKLPLKNTVSAESDFDFMN